MINRRVSEHPHAGAAPARARRRGRLFKEFQLTPQPLTPAPGARAQCRCTSHSYNMFVDFLRIATLDDGGIGIKSMTETRIKGPGSGPILKTGLGSKSIVGAELNSKARPRSKSGTITGPKWSAAHVWTRTDSWEELDKKGSHPAAV
ncbi:hypothetical protein EVAR_2773_1 [Eumeta japonica]|uniref:Uncharacterized protein n=1 Tax=Eumeta variegata TaxID=151549 RepID=A0A4C1SZL8_EUMVA|nr:hypothetical protein EVAR_2773_1 [Eumeta japonica]